jgi:hypothetical protein
MNYNQLLGTLSEVINNENIYKPGLKLVYELDRHNHRELEEHVFNLRNSNDEFKPANVFELESDGIIIQLIKKK